MKGIILAGGSGTRLYPMTRFTSKQLLPVYDKPMIYYPLSLLMLGGIREVLLICRPEDRPNFENLLGNGHAIGIQISYAEQAQPRGLPEAYIIGENFLNGSSSTLILGDNLFYGDITWFKESLSKHREQEEGAHLFGYHVADPRAYGVVEMSEGDESVKSIEEKPDHPKSNYAIPGLYICDGSAPNRAKKLSPSKRGETEITDLLKSYMFDGQLFARKIGRGVAWLDTGTPKSLLEASEYIGAIEARQNLKVACLEEIAFRKGFVDKVKFQASVDSLPQCDYKNYLQNLFL